MTGAELYGQPTAAELLEAAREFLANELIPALDGHLRFHARVTENVLGIVAREIELGPEHEDRHARRLRALGYDDDRALAAAIRRGEMDDRTDEVRSALRDAVDARIAVANPQYRAPEA